MKLKREQEKKRKDEKKINGREKKLTHQQVSGLALCYIYCSRAAPK